MTQPHIHTALLLALTAAPSAAQVTCGSTGEVFAQCPASAGFSVSDVAATVRAADDFSLGSPASVERIRWWGTYADGSGTQPCGAPADLFTVRVWGDSGGAGPLSSSLIADLGGLPLTRSPAPVTQMNLGGSTFDVYEYELDLGAAPLGVPAGATWWLEVHNDLSASFGCYWNWVIDPAPSNGFYSYSVHWPGQPPWTVSTFPTQTPGFDLAFCLLGAGGPPTYCTAGTSASGCNASIAASGTPSASAGSGFELLASGVEGNKDGLFFYGKSGRQANPWGNGTSFQCVVPPVKRGGLLSAVGAPGTCGGSFAQDLNARWCPSCPKPQHNPGAGALVQAQLWYRDPLNTGNQTTSLSDAIEFTVAP